MATNLKQFLLSKMRMSGPYQPIVIKNIILNDGEVSIDKVAEDLSRCDPESQKYYRSKLAIFPKQVLANHKVAELKDNKWRFFKDLIFDTSEREEILKICDSKLDDYYAKHPTDLDANNGWGRKRILMLEKQPFCSLCGAKPSLDVELDCRISVICTRRFPDCVPPLNS